MGAVALREAGLQVQVALFLCVGEEAEVLTVALMRGRAVVV